MQTKYKVKEIFYSIQGEGAHTGRPAVFIRFSGCNLRCPFCDTDFSDGELMTGEEIVSQTIKVSAGNDSTTPCAFVVLTGGEPTLWPLEELIGKLHEAHFYVAVETNGTRPFPGNADWITVSPKSAFCEGAKLYSNPLPPSEVKVVYTGDNHPEAYANMNVTFKFLQPCDTGDPEKNEEVIAKTVEWLKAHPDWRLSLQTQKIINVR